MRFPFPLGAGVFASETRQESAENTLVRFSGKGGYGDDPDLVISRTRQILARGMQSISLTCDRVMEQIFPGTSHPDELLPDWQTHLRWVPRQPDTLESRQAAVAAIFGDVSGQRTGLGEGSGRGIDTKQYLEKIVGKGNCTYRFNTAKFLSDGGYDPLGIFSVAFELPLSEISTVGQLTRLREIINPHIPAHVGVALTRIVSRGFLVDDPQSLVGRDVLRV